MRCMGAVRGGSRPAAVQDVNHNDHLSSGQMPPLHHRSATTASCTTAGGQSAINKSTTSAPIVQMHALKGICYQKDGEGKGGKSNVFLSNFLVGAS